MSVYFGLVAATILSIVVAIGFAALGFRDGDRPGDARVTVRAIRAAQAAQAHPDGLAPGAAVFAEIVVDNRHDSAVMVSAQTRPASVLALPFVASGGRRTALTHRRRLDGVELLGAVDGRGIRRYLLPLTQTHGAVRVTVSVDQLALRTRLVSATLLPGRALPEPTAWPAARPSERELP